MQLLVLITYNNTCELIKSFIRPTCALDSYKQVDHPYIIS
jgi:hypothetical protein